MQNHIINGIKKQLLAKQSLNLQDFPALVTPTILKTIKFQP